MHAQRELDASRLVFLWGVARAILTARAVLLYDRRLYTPHLMTRLRGPHEGRSDCGRWPREHDTHVIS